jgi:hypothetical protein
MSYDCLIFLTVLFKVLPFYVFIRLLVASYLFMSSYGHFTYFWKKGDFSLYRFCQVTEASLYFLTELRLLSTVAFSSYSWESSNLSQILTDSSLIFSF